MSAPPTMPRLTNAQRELVSENINAVRSIVAEFVARHRVPDQDREDMFQEGVIAMMYAATRYRPSVGVGFSTYAKHSVRWALCAANRQRYMVGHRGAGDSREHLTQVDDFTFDRLRAEPIDHVARVAASQSVKALEHLKLSARNRERLELFLEREFSDADGKSKDLCARLGVTKTIVRKRYLEGAALFNAWATEFRGDWVTE